MAFGRTVQLFLMDGSPKGRIKCSLDNWTGKVYLIPRTELTRSKDRVDLSQTGIYLLFGTDTETGDEKLYVGQARERKNGNGVLARIAEHLGEEKLDYFTHAIVIIDSTNSLGPTEISYLENAFYQQAVAAGRVQTINGNDPSPGNVTEEKKAALDEFIANSKILIGSLGYRVFDAVDDAKTVIPAPMDSTPNAEPLLHLKCASASGDGRQTTDGFVVLAGAKLRLRMTDSAPESAKKNRQRFADRISASGELLRDTLFTSPSAASNFLIGSSTSGKVTWKDEAGRTLRELEEAVLKAAKDSQQQAKRMSQPVKEKR
ncbi:GIY-YIG nuclease family protein [Cutibacterium sp.]|uniref:GIY-YIG nuclease family protein n=1 Tax=Cutibacterium sp. TaxID=1912221 RepID=UPI0026DA82A0|nr:GIY-YIG nuclease family protein [Cutibacterium sp.]MDO4412302.1 GIY-YIG nuclease family protein [Cutibacterium sp.]